MTVVDSSVVVDFLLGSGVDEQAEQLLLGDAEAAAPDVLVFEVLAVLRRGVLRGSLAADRATTAVADLALLPIALFPALELRDRAWQLRANMTVAAALFVALAEELGEPLATKDEGLAAAAATWSLAAVTLLRDP